MHRQILIGCWPYLALLVASTLVLRGLVWASRVRPDLTRLRRLHADQAGAVQSLSFVLTLPLFVIVLMFIVQLSQLTIAKVVVEYAAYAAARATIVWLPANLGDGVEGENQFSTCWQRRGTFQQGAGPRFEEYWIAPTGKKFEKIHQSAALACLSICPSRGVAASSGRSGGAGPGAPAPGNAAAIQGAYDALQRAYSALSPASSSNPRIPRRLQNKLAYAAANTRLAITIRHREDEPPLRLYPHLCRDRLPYYPGEQFQCGEFGWQDQVVVTVEHDFALLPGPGRILARRADAPIGSDPDANRSADYQSGRIQRRGATLFVYPLSATVRLSNEGERSRMSFVHSIDGRPTNFGALASSWEAASTYSAGGAAVNANLLSRGIGPPPALGCLECRESEEKSP